MNLKSASLNEAAKYLNYSKQYLCRIVKEMTGQTFTKMLTDMKIETAKKYMLESQLTFGEIAELTGFTEASYLNRIFKRYEGISPSKFMEKNRNLP